MLGICMKSKTRDGPCVVHSFLTINSDVMFTLILPSHIDGDAGVSASVDHLSVSDTENSAIAEDLSPRAGSQRSAIF